jgi:hypothetical protein
MTQQLYTRPNGKTAELLATHLPDADRILTAGEARLLRFILGIPATTKPTEPGWLSPCIPEIPLRAPDAATRRPQRLRWLRR